MGKNFALIGASGFVAPRHMAAIKDVGENLVAALDPHDACGILDSYFPSCRLFTEFERFDRHCEKLRRTESPITHVSICSPNYLHSSHIMFGLRIGADVICEKPLVLNTRNLKELALLEAETGKRVNAILQLRYHPEALRMREIYGGESGDRHLVEISYTTPRGNWYSSAWKSDESKSGGLATNIGVHLFDIATWIFGDMIEPPYAHTKNHQRVAGRLYLERATVDFKLSIAMNEKPERLFVVDGEQFELSGGFRDLHSTVYREVLEGRGYGIDDAYESIRVIEQIRNIHACPKCA